MYGSNLPFPSREEEIRAWEELAQKIAANKEKAQNPVIPPPYRGELTVIGSGIQALDFLQADVELIEKADAVFYCVADPCTVIWIKQKRPDAYNLYVLYSNHKVRNITYTEMSEAILHYVREGKKVVAIFYGHPGIFAFSPHRAILIAKKEGHRAQMRPGISALDCLCADLHIDPAHPGMQTHEATDLLVRKRKIDPTLHVVLWQVGLIGEMGYRDRGYLNQRFCFLVEYLEKSYGKDHLITHYIASRYATVKPTIETFVLSKLYHPEIQIQFTGISTFYIPPKEESSIDPEMAQKLGFASKDKTFLPDPLIRKMDLYGAKELAAFDDLKTFRVPPYYHHQENTAAGQFLISLQRDRDLQKLFKKDPKLAFETFPDLSPTDRYFLKKNTGSSLQIATKGLSTPDQEGERLIRDLFSSQVLPRSLLEKVSCARSRDQVKEGLRVWEEEKRYHPKWETLWNTWSRLSQNFLFLWNGPYLSEDGNYVITLLGSSNPKKGGHLSVNGKEIIHFSFQNGILKWGAKDVPFQGFFKCDRSVTGKRRLFGHIWEMEAPTPGAPFISLKEIEPCGPTINQVSGMYELQEPQTAYLSAPEKKHSLVITPPHPTHKRRSFQVHLKGVSLGEQEVKHHYRPYRLEILGEIHPMEKTSEVESYWEPCQKISPWFHGTYVLNINKGSGEKAQLILAEDQVLYNKEEAVIVHQTHKWIQWRTMEASASLVLLIEPTTLLPSFYGTIDLLGSTYSCFGMIPHSFVSGGAAEEALHEIPQERWVEMLELHRSKSHQGNGFFWLQWQSSRLSHRALQAITGMLRGV